MERNIPSYAAALAENNLEVLEDIIANRYIEFIDFYWMLKEYTEFIDSLKMKEKKDGLKIGIHMSKLNINDVIENLECNVPKKSKCEIEKKNKEIIITLFRM
jgi:hypothetical protein